MPRTTPRQQLAEQLFHEYMVAVFAAADERAQEDAEIAESDSESSNSSSDSSDSDSDSDIDWYENVIPDAIILALQELYADRYPDGRRDIPKSGIALRLLLDVYRVEFPDIFRSDVNLSAFDIFLTVESF